MKPEELSDYIGEIDEELIAGAKGKNHINKKKTFYAVTFTTVAAVMFFGVLSAAILLNVNKFTDVVNDTPISEGVSEQQDNINTKSTKGVDHSTDNKQVTEKGSTTEQSSISTGGAYKSSELTIDFYYEDLTEWQGKKIYDSLKDALNEDDGNTVYKIAAIPPIDDNYIYNGKTLREYSKQKEKGYVLSELLASLLKEGDYLKYGTALYETGTPDGEKWAKEFYEERIAYYGEELLSTYIVNGEFLKDKAEQDMNIAKENETSEYKDAEDAYKNAIHAYMTEIAAKVNGEAAGNCIIIYMTKKQFSAFTVDDIEKWTFGLPEGE
ncbi:MAG: hypothetical protein IIT39_05030 [Clostridia bacterium]|nr:hypothetical protein [Clostridia bacterium]